MTIEQFYEECASLLDTTHEGVAFTHYRRTRWNNRAPGRGRFPDHGIIRVFGDQVHFALTAPPLQACVPLDGALDFLRAALSKTV